MDKKSRGLKAACQFILVALLWFSPSLSLAAAPAGYSEFFVPGSEQDLLIFHNAVNNTAFTTTHSIISVVAWAPNTIVYYDHWENGYYFDPQDPEKVDPSYPGPGHHSYDEKLTLLTRGASHTFESTYIPAAPRNPANIYYDGKDKIYAVGGPVTVSRMSWPDAADTNEAIGIEVYQVGPLLTTYIMPVGENLYTGTVSNPDFTKVFALLQATTDGTIVQFDLNGDGVLGDSVCTNRTYPCTATATQITLNAGETFLLDRYASSPTTGNPTTTGARLNVGSMIQGNKTVQVHYLFCNSPTNYNSRGISAFPTGLWSTEYYAPVGTDTGANYPTDIYVYNPHSTALTITYQSLTTSGTFSVPAKTTVSYYNATGGYAAQNSATYLRGSDVFWGFSSIDRGGQTNDWSYSLIPPQLLTKEYYLSWAPGAYPVSMTYPNASGLYITAAQDNTRVYIDTNSDGVAEQTYDLAFLQSQYVYDATDGDMSQSHIWSTGPISVAYGENPDTAPASSPAIDTGDAIISQNKYVDTVIKATETTNPVVVATASGSQATYTIVIDSAKYSVNSISVVDTLPAGWAYVAGTTSITLADKTTSTANPVLSGTGNRTLTWSGLGTMAANQQITITFTAQTTQAFTAGAITQNYVEATGTRVVGNPATTQTFTTSDFVFNTYSATSSQMAVVKTSSGVDPLAPGDTFTYTVNVTNNGTSSLTNVSISDPLPDGVSYVASSSQVTYQKLQNVQDTFASAAYTLNTGSANWSTNWIETDSLGGGATGGLVSVTGNQLQFAYTSGATNNVSDTFSAVSYANNNGTRNWAGDWAETDFQGTTAGPTAGFVLVTGNTLQLRYQTANVADNFGSVSYSINDGSNNWTTSWTETGDDNLPGSGTITATGARINFGPGAAGRAITRTAAVSGTSATISFTLSDNGIDAGEGVIASYSLNGGSTWTEIQRIDNNALTGTNPLTISTVGATSISLRFVTFGTYTGNDNAGVDNVNIVFNDAVGAAIQRTADLTGYASATLTFDFNRAQLETTDTMVVEASSSASGPFTTLATYNSATTVGTKTFNIASYISAATTIRYRVTNELNATNEFFSIDNVNISHTGNFSANGSQIVRTANLTGATRATLSFDFNRANLEAGDTMVAEVNGGSGFTTLATFDSTTAIGTKTYNIASYIAAATTVRFRVTGGVNDTGEYFSIDNVDISYVQPTALAAAHNPPNFVVTGDAYTLTAGLALTLTYNVTVNSPLATGITSITNTACVTAAGFLVPTCADVTNIVNNPSSSSATVGDRVWFDVDGDGVQDVGEPGLANVEVTLKDQYGAPVAVTTTGGNGDYLFEGVEVGTGYYVQVTGGLPSGLAQSFPSGRTDGRTNTFNLTAGQIYLDADLGYKAATGNAVIGDYVWHDADGDKVQDGGEPGLSGISVVLWRDDGDGVFQGAGQDIQVATQLTGADGHYLFSVASPAGNTYFVSVDQTQAALTEYTATTALVMTIAGLANGNASLINDFGFRNTTTTYTLRDRVWFDQNADGEDDVSANDNNETGIAGVTVDLLNASRVVIATTETDASGYFTFVGLPGAGADYTVRITDTNGKLTDYYGTTAASLAGELQINNLTASLDYTVEPAEPHFGYNVKGSIGDTVFNDVNGDGIQNAGELGISGVTVALYLDTNGNGLLNTGEPLAATLITDANGHYMFSGLADGNFIVSIASPPSGFAYTTESPDNDPAAGDQQSASVSGSSSVLTKDFGYRVPPANQRSVSGTIWEDSDLDGIIDGGESGLGNVTVDLLNSGGTVVGTATTDASGYYAFTGLLAGVYTVRLTDKNGILTDYATTYEVTEGFGAGSYNGQESINLTTGNASNINFGFINPRTTRAVIGEFGAFSDRGKVVVRWRTLSEQGTIGFYLYRLDEKSGAYKIINNKLLPGLLHSPAGGWYSYQDTTAKTGVQYTYRLEEVEVGGARLSYGPWTVFTGTPLSAENSGIELKANAYVSGFKQAAQPLFQKTRERLEVGMKARLDARRLKLALKGIQAKISVTEDGLYFVNADDIARVLNKNRDKVVQLIQANRIRLRNKDRSVAVLPSSDNSGLYFYGEKLETSYADENVYWLDVDTAMKMCKVNRAPKVPAGEAQYFQQWVREEESHYPVLGIFSDPQEDIWMWDYVFPGYGRDQVSIAVSTPGIMDNNTATLKVALQGASEAFVGDDHHAVISVNGVVVGDARWDGNTASIVSCPVGTDILHNGENSVEISGIQEPGVPYDIFYLNYVTIEYPRHYTAVDNHLAAESNSYDTVEINGFTDSDIRVFDIADPLHPKLLVGAEIETAETNADEYQVAFQTGDQAGRYLAVAPNAIKSCELAADQPSSLSKKSNRGNYLIITSGDLLDAAQELADYRAAQGYKAMVVDVEDIYDEFSYGIKDAEAIRAFLRIAYSTWRIPPKYVVLAGEGSFDYKDYMGFGDCLIPPLLTATPEGLFVTDNLYGDVLGDDGIPEFSVGRIPVISAEEFSGYTSKVIGYESAVAERALHALLAADAADAGGNFTGSSEEVAGLFPKNFAIDRIYLDTMPLADARVDFLTNINEGRAFVNFIGHGGMTLIGNKDLFSNDKLAQLENGDRLPVVTAMTCLSGNFGYPGFDSISEAMVLKENGGAVAMWSPSGFAFNNYSVKLCKGFYTAVFNSGEKTLGNAIRSAQKNYAEAGKQLSYLHLYNLIGDPALVLK